MIKYLSKGDCIGVVSPASVPDMSVLQEGREYLESLGYRVKLFGEGSAPFGRMAGTDGARARYIEQAFADAEVTIILCSRGGYGSGRVLDLLNYSLIRQFPKPFIGYSDITNLLFALRKHASIPVFHGPMLTDLVTRQDEWTKANFFERLGGGEWRYELRPGEFQLMKPGHTSGDFLGGNISIISTMLGTDSIDRRFRGILMLEDVNEFAYSLDRMLVQFKRSGFLSNVTGVLIADLNLKDPGPDNSLGIDLDDLLRFHFSEFDGPIAYGLPCGHTQRQLLLPLCSRSELHISGEALSLQFMPADIAIESKRVA